MARARASASSETAKTVASFANTTSEDGARAFKRAKKSCELAGKVVERAATDDSGSGRSNAIVRDSAHALVSNVRKSVESNARAVEIRARETEDGDD
ncbi:unnamed product [Ostreococcus tauri]|uniref:Unnamed product n=1 Tax=Ostreococcus tauri TaxID=70448 RepID=A0A096P851_OSTTA|nr:unnamed product [Ostreococcus tauri]CEG00391.1 unnamed product [Ostreococcus tauri]|eukprot:XP_022840355.1 unnamed product [Ostreococcus tauri]